MQVVESTRGAKKYGSDSAESTQKYAFGRLFWGEGQGGRQEPSVQVPNKNVKFGVRNSEWVKMQGWRIDDGKRDRLKAEPQTGEGAGLYRFSPV